MSIRASVSAQRLNDRVRIQRPVLDGNGDIIDWETIGPSTVSAAVDGEKVKGFERAIADGTRSLGLFTVWLRSDVVERTQLAETFRLVWIRANRPDVLLDIKDVLDQGRRGRLIPMLCECGANKG